ncbi:hypothetical protein BH23CHL2_BH23CHL2_22160 [soil metagenome]
MPTAFRSSIALAAPATRATTLPFPTKAVAPTSATFLVELPRHCYGQPCRSAISRDRAEWVHRTGFEESAWAGTTASRPRLLSIGDDGLTNRSRFPTGNDRSDPTDPAHSTRSPSISWLKMSMRRRRRVVLLPKLDSVDLYGRSERIGSHSAVRLAKDLLGGRVEPADQQMVARVLQIARIR